MVSEANHPISAHRALNAPGNFNHDIAEMLYHRTTSAFPFSPSYVLTQILFNSE